LVHVDFGGEVSTNGVRFIPLVTENKFDRVTGARWKVYTN
jgi:hypothetical protein